MNCPYCGYAETKVLDTRSTDEGAMIRRRRECEKCARRFTTYEKVEEFPLVVIKKDGRREEFDRNKIVRSMLRACEKRSVALGTVEQIADEIEKDLRNSLLREVETRRIGEMVMDRLRAVDEVAYVRFASVYRQFRDISTFMEELSKLLK